MSIKQRLCMHWYRQQRRPQSLIKNVNGWCSMKSAHFWVTSARNRTSIHRRAVAHIWTQEVCYFISPSRLHTYTLWIFGFDVCACVCLNVCLAWFECVVLDWLYSLWLLLSVCFWFVLLDLFCVFLQISHRVSTDVIIGLILFMRQLGLFEILQWLTSCCNIFDPFSLCFVFFSVAVCVSFIDLCLIWLCAWFARFVLCVYVAWFPFCYCVWWWVCAYLLLFCE